MATGGGDIRERLSALWEQFGLEPDVATAAAQHQAAVAVEAWLTKGKENPEIAIRAAQVLLADPERPGANKRPAWIALRNVLTEAWPNAGTTGQHIFYAQALLLATWPWGAQEGWLGIAILFDSARTATRGSKQHQEAIRRWRGHIAVRRSTAQQFTANAAPNPPKNDVTPFGGISFDVTAALQHIHARQTGQHQWNQVGPQVVEVLREYQSGLTILSEGLKLISQQIARHSQGLVTYVEDVAKTRVINEIQGMHEEIRNGRAELDLLWWGQARYCHALATPYRRLSRTDAEAVLWWAAYEAAKLSLELETEAAAAYLIETLSSLGQDVFERKPLRQWIENTHTVLIAADKPPPIGDRLISIVSSDALGLPVTWARLKAARKEPLDSAADDIALDMDAEIDRGDWASWIFREVLLDLHLAHKS